MKSFFEGQEWSGRCRGRWGSRGQSYTRRIEAVSSSTLRYITLDGPNVGRRSTVAKSTFDKWAEFRAVPDLKKLPDAVMTSPAPGAPAKKGLTFNVLRKIVKDSSLSFDDLVVGDTVRSISDKCYYLFVEDEEGDLILLNLKSCQAHSADNVDGPFEYINVNITVEE